MMAGTIALMTGSSPRVLGTVTSARTCSQATIWHRFIPARAGNSDGDPIRVP